MPGAGSVPLPGTRDGRPELRSTPAALRSGDTLVIYEPDRVARSMKELLVLLEDHLHARGINLHILTVADTNWVARLS